MICYGIFNNRFIDNFIKSVPVKFFLQYLLKIWKRVWCLPFSLIVYMYIISVHRKASLVMRRLPISKYYRDITSEGNIY